jgi:hypothetical protein
LETKWKNVSGRTLGFAFLGGNSLVEEMHGSLVEIGGSLVEIDG